MCQLVLLDFRVIQRISIDEILDYDFLDTDMDNLK